MIEFYPMQDIIQLLPDSIANQIAAGEVVQRPSSVVKELMENAIDAKASEIQVIIKDAGKGFIQVIDNGIGMSETDARLSFERHATSKIRKAEDLFKILTMGFRGEALASIASVAQVELTTKRAIDELGTTIRIEASVLKSQESIAAKNGTSLKVSNLFYNIPARRNFLKSNPVEIRHILDEFQRVALANPSIKFSFIQNGEETYSLAPEKLGKRIVDLFGKNYREQLAPCEENTSYLQIKGYVGKPEMARKSRGEQFIFVNNRFIKNSYINHAIISAYEQLIPEGHFPFYVLFLTIDPNHIDINVHPTKTEIKFDDEKSIYALVHSTVRKTLSITNMAQSIDFNSNTNLLNDLKKPLNILNSTNSQSSFQLKNKPVEENWQSLYQGLKDNISQFEDQKGQDNKDLFILQSKANEIQDTESTKKSFEYFQLSPGFIGLVKSNEFYIIHQKRAFQRIYFDQFQKSIQNKSSYTQQLLFPYNLAIPQIDLALFEENIPIFHQFGFKIVKQQGNHFSIEGIPQDFKDWNIENLIQEIIEKIKQDVSEFKLNYQENMSILLANKAASMFGEKIMNTEELKALIEQIFASSNPNYTPKGEKILLNFNQETLKGLFI